MPDANDESRLILPPPPFKRGRGRPRKERKPQRLCRSNGRFIRCPDLGPRPAKLRAHRTVCGVDAEFTCPRGATLIRNPPGPKGAHLMSGRKEACLFVPPGGSKQPARFVPAICGGSSRGTRTMPPPRPRPANLPSSPPADPPPFTYYVPRRPTSFPPPSARAPTLLPPPPETSARRARGPKVYDWSKCRCAPGLKTFKLSSGALRCQGPKGFVRALCDESAYSRSEPTGQASAASRRKKAKKKAKRS